MLRKLLGAVAPFAMAAAMTLGPAVAQDLVYVGYSHTEQASIALMEEEFARFRSEHPDIELEVIGYPWRNTFQQLVLQHQAGAPPDVTQASASWANVFAELDALVDLNEVFGRDWLEQNFSEPALAIGNFDGKQLSIPDSFSSIGMVVNLQTLKEAGVEILPETIDEFTAVLRKVKEANPDSVPFAISTRNPGVMHTDFNTIVWSFGGKLIQSDGTVTADSPEALAALEWLVMLMNEGLIAPEIQRGDARQLHSQFLTAFSFDAPSVRGFAREMSGKGEEIDYAISSMPTPVLNDSITPRAAIYGRTYMLFQQPGETVTAESPAAIMLRDLFLSNEFQTKNYERTGNFPSNLEVAAEISEPYVDNWLSHAATAIDVDTAPYANAADLQTIIAEEYQAAILGAKSADEALQDMQARLTDALE